MKQKLQKCIILQKKQIHPFFSTFFLAKISIILYFYGHEKRKLCNPFLVVAGSITSESSFCV